MPGDAPKAADHNGWRQITSPSREMVTGLKILVSAVQSRPSPPFISNRSKGALGTSRILGYVKFNRGPAGHRVLNYERRPGRPPEIR